MCKYIYIIHIYICDLQRVVHPFTNQSTVSSSAVHDSSRLLGVSFTWLRGYQSFLSWLEASGIGRRHTLWQTWLAGNTPKEMEVYSWENHQTQASATSQL